MTEAGFDTSDAIDWASRRGVAPSGPLTQRPLSGGVSSSIFAVEGPASGVVVKRALAELRVDTIWRANPQRSVIEAHALAVFAAITPDRVPQVIDLDPLTCTIVMERAPADAVSWRTALLSGPTDPAIGAALGSTLGAWHRATWQPWAGASDFEDREGLDQLRLEPFHLAVARQFPDLSATILRCARELRQARTCLVHGDASPKNVLVGPTCLWLIDPEVAHMGDPVFDIAFMGAHLILNALARPELAGSIQQVWLAFLEAYLGHAPNAGIDERLEPHLGAILLARTDGVSREPGLTPRAVEQARAVGGLFVGRANQPSRALWQSVADALI